MDLFYGLISGAQNKCKEKGKTISNIHTPEKKSFALWYCIWYSEFIIIVHNILKGIQNLGKFLIF